MRGGVRKRGDRWAAYWDLPVADGQRRRQGTKSGFPTKKAAQAFLTEQLAAIRRGEFVARDRMTFAAWFQVWIVTAETRLKPATADKYRRDFARYVAPSLGGVQLQSLTAVQLDRLYSDLLAGRHAGPRSGRSASDGKLSGTTVGHVHRLVHKVLADALKKGIVVRNVASAATPPKQVQPGQQELTVWTPDQLRQFLAAVAEHRLSALCRLLVLTGCRRGEALGARWSDIDLETGRWIIRRSRGVVNGSPIDGPPKSGKSRTVSLDHGTVAALRSHRARQNAEKLAWGAAYQDSSNVFAHENGDPLHPNVMTRTFVRLAERAGLPRIRLHDVRHSAVTAMLAKGEPVLTVFQKGRPCVNLVHAGRVRPCSRTDGPGRRCPPGRGDRRLTAPSAVTTRLDSVGLPWMAVL